MYLLNLHTTPKGHLIGLMQVYPKAIVLTTKPHSNVRECIASLRGLVVRTITLGKTRIRAIEIGTFLQKNDSY